MEFSTRNLLIICIASEWILPRKQEGKPCGEVFFESEDVVRNCGQCDEGLFCSPSMSPALPMQCGKCVKRNVRDRIDEMDLRSKEKGKSNMYSNKDRLGDLNLIKLISMSHKRNISESKLPNIVELAKATPELSTLYTAIGAAGLVDTLTGKEPFTVFAPHNDVFAKRPYLLKPENKKDLKRTLLRHVKRKELKSTRFPKGNIYLKLKTVGGAEIRIRMGPSKKAYLVQSNIDEADVIKTDLMARNGVIHIVNNIF